MISIRKPSPATIDRFLASQTPLHFTYSDIGATAKSPPAGYVVDHTRIQLGDGENVYRLAIESLRQWEQFHLGWVEAWPTSTPLEAGKVIAVLGRAMGLWWLNACRIVYVIDDSGHVSRFGFAYGTLPGHAESGEERFLIEWDRQDDRVWYDILAFSRPNRVLAQLGYPLVRRLQKRFGQHSTAAMKRAVQTARGSRPNGGVLE